MEGILTSCGVSTSHPYDLRRESDALHRPASRRGRPTGNASPYPLRWAPILPPAKPRLTISDSFRSEAHAYLIVSVGAGTHRPIRKCPRREDSS